MPCFPAKLVIKRAADVIGACMLLAISAPIIVAAACAVLVTMGWPIFYRDVRAGRDGRPFELVKFRSMRALRAGETIPESDAARITRVGRFLRASSIDELPSLVQVLTGQLSLVGPRPLPIRYVERFTPEQAERLALRPGITGLAQAYGRNELSWDEKLHMDVWYCRNWSLRLDVRIVLQTARAVLSRQGISHGEHASMPEFQGLAVSTVIDAADGGRT
jgi:lipopolysaccharide/colanic/teichoic acid biosynthesis glycosyltransferase